VEEEKLQKLKARPKDKSATCLEQHRVEERGCEEFGVVQGVLRELEVVMDKGTGLLTCVWRRGGWAARNFQRTAWATDTRRGATRLHLLVVVHGALLA
jgi:hypothetical protein